MDFNATQDMSLINQQLEEAERKENEHLASFDFMKHYIYIYPMTPDAGDENLDAVSLEAYGMDWQFMMDDPTNGGLFRLITYDMMDIWDITFNDLMNAVLENIRRYMPNTMCRIIFGKPCTGVVMPILKVYLAKGSPFPPYGASTMLLEEVKERVFDRIGEYCMFPMDEFSFYALPLSELRKHHLDSLEAFDNIMMCNPFGGPMVWKEERLFPEKKMNLNWYV